MPETATRRTRIWRNRDFRLIWAAQSLSNLGTGMSQLAYPLLMLAITGSPAQAGALAAVRALPYAIFGLPAGALTDRWPRRRVMIVCDSIRAVALLCVPIALWTHLLHPVQLYVVGFVAGTAYVFFSAAEAGALPNLVAADDLSAAVSAQEVSASASGIVASPIGGVLFGLFHGLPFLVDAVSFAGSAAALSAVRTRFESRHHAEPERHIRSDVLAGLTWLWRHPVLRPVALTAGALQIAISGVGLLVIVGARADGASSTVIGVLLAAAGVGGVIGASTATRVRQRLGFAPTLIAVAATQTILWVLFAVSPTEWMTGAVLVLFAATMPIFGVAVLSYQMAQTPDELRGRVGTAFGLMTWGATPIGAAAAGLLLDHLSVTSTALLFAAWTAAVAAGSAVAIARGGQQS